MRWKNPKFFRPFNYGPSTYLPLTLALPCGLGCEWEAKLANEIANLSPISFLPFVRPSVNQSVRPSVFLRWCGKTGKFFTSLPVLTPPPPWCTHLVIMQNKQKKTPPRQGESIELEVLWKHKIFNFLPVGFPCCKVFRWKKNRRSVGRKEVKVPTSWNAFLGCLRRDSWSGQCSSFGKVSIKFNELRYFCKMFSVWKNA